MCFQIDGKSSQVAKYVKSKIMTNVINCILLIDTFEQQCVRIKGMLHPPGLKDHMKTIAIKQSLRNSARFEHMCLQKPRNYTNMLGSVTI